MENETCTICIDDIKNNKITLSECKHSFHKKCLDKFIKNKINKLENKNNFEMFKILVCPNCRKNINLNLNNLYENYCENLIMDEFITLLNLPNVNYNYMISLIDNLDIDNIDDEQLYNIISKTYFYKYLNSFINKFYLTKTITNPSILYLIIINFNINNQLYNTLFKYHENSFFTEIIIKYIKTIEIKKLSIHHSKNLFQFIKFLFYHKKHIITDVNIFDYLLRICYAILFSNFKNKIDNNNIYTVLLHLSDAFPSFISKSSLYVDCLVYINFITDEEIINHFKYNLNNYVINYNNLVNIYITQRLTLYKYYVSLIKSHKIPLTFDLCNKFSLLLINQTYENEQETNYLESTLSLFDNFTVNIINKLFEEILYTLSINKKNSINKILLLNLAYKFKSYVFFENIEWYIVSNLCTTHSNTDFEYSEFFNYFLNYIINLNIEEYSNLTFFSNKIKKYPSFLYYCFKYLPHISLILLEKIDFSDIEYISLHETYTNDTYYKSTPLHILLESRYKAFYLQEIETNNVLKEKLILFINKKNYNGDTPIIYSKKFLNYFENEKFTKIFI